MNTSTFTGHSGAALRFDAAGHGMPVLALHGAYSARVELREALEPILAPLDVHRRIYPDLPGMGDSPAHETIRTTNDVVDLVDEFVQSEIGEAPFLLVGHSFGGHLARGVAARRPDQVAGLALICPAMPAAMNSEPHTIVTRDGDPTDWLDPAVVDEYTGYFVVHTPATAERFRQAVVPVIGRFDADAVEQTMTEWALDPDPDAVPFDQPTLVVTGRHDSLVGFRDQIALLDRYPRASYVTVADSGHAVLHERRELVGALIGDWLPPSTRSGNDVTRRRTENEADTGKPSTVAPARRRGPGRVIWNTMMSLDGFVADADETMEWVFDFDVGDGLTAGELVERAGALLVGRRTMDVEDRNTPGFFGGAFRGPFFVLTHDTDRPSPIVKGVTGQLVDGPIEDVVEQVAAAAEGGDVIVLGGTVATECLNAGLLDEVIVFVAPTMLGAGIQLYSGPARRFDLVSTRREGEITTLRLTPR